MNIKSIVKHTSRPGMKSDLKRVFAVLVIFLSLVPVVSADLFSPDRPVSIVETEYFSFIFAPESARAVDYLASFADDEYRDVARFLGTIPRLHIPVVLTPDFEELNGYFTEYPYPLIVMYQAATDPDSMIGSFKDDVRKLFRHELTHAVSLTIRSRFEDFFADIFGTPMSLSTYLTPMNFIEGVTVSLESMDGYGRAVDPLAAAMIRQDIMEGQRRSFQGTAGEWDLYPGRNLYYIYGGYFSRYLQERWGMEKYAELWQTFGAASLLRGLDDFLWIDGRMTKIFGVSLTEAWNDFLETMAPKMPVYMDNKTLTRASGTSALAASTTELFYADNYRGSVFAYDPVNEKERRLFRAGFWVSRLDVSPDEEKVLISTVRYEGDFPKLAVKEWNSKTGRMVDIHIDNLRDAVYLPGDGPRKGSILGVSIDGYQTSLTILQEGVSTTLVRGSERINWTSPVSNTDGTVLYVIARIDGVASIIRLDLQWTSSDTGATCTIGKVWKLAVPAPISWIRYLSLSADGVLRFSWDDALFYRLAELKGNVLGYQSVPISGGIHQPAGTSGKVYHLGRFSNGIAVCEFPDDRNPLGFIEAEVRWIEAPELLDPPSIYDHAPVMDSKPYTALRWLLPRFWLPSISLDGGGLLSAGIDMYLGDPLRRLEASLGADWDFRAHAVDMEVSATWARFNSPVTLDLHDTFYSPFEGDITRVSGVSLGIGNAHPFFSGGALSWNVEASMTGLSLVSAGSPVYAPWTSFGTTFGTVLAWDDTLAPLHDAEAKTGYNAALRAQLDWDFTTVLPEAGFEASLQGFLEPMAIATKLYGAVAATTSIAYGPFGRSCAEGYTISGSYPVWTEFASGESGPLYTEGEASFRLFGTEIQKGIGAFYANRLSIRSGVRGYATINTSSTDWLSDHGWSAFGRASLTWTPSVGVWATIHPTSYIEFWFRPEMAGTPGRTHGASYMLIASY